MNNNKQKYDNFARDLGFVENKKENNLLTNLLKKPRKDDNHNTPHTNNPMKNGSHQADLLFLPTDRGYKYALVVVDIATRKTDAEPLKGKTSKEVLSAMKTIYKRKYLNEPNYLEVDGGSEFKDVFETYFENRLELRFKEAGRHRQQSVVETRNGLIGKILNKRMVGQEINTNIQSTEWVNFLPKVVKAINEHYTINPVKIDANAPIAGSKDTLNILPEGTPVRTQLDNPADHLTNHRLYGGFRQGDVRWTKTTKPITQIFLRPDFPPMYQVGGNDNVAFTKNQLQVVKPNEVRPNPQLQERHLVDRLLRRFKKSNKIFFEVKWTDGTTTEEPRTNLIKDIPIIVKEFEKNNR